MRWVIVLNAVNCRLFNYSKQPNSLELILEINHQENRLKREDFLTSDKPGHYKSSQSNRGAYAQRTDPKEVELDNFARDVAKLLNQGRVERRFDKLVLIGTPHMNGLLLHHLDKHVKELVTNEIQKDLQHVKEKEILEFLNTHAKFPDEKLAR